jgi:hypothetical protein
MTTLLTHQASAKAAPASPAGRGRIRAACHRIVLAVQEMNYASRRMVELQAPWSVDNQRHGK